MTQAIEKAKMELDVFGADFEQAQRIGKALASSPFVPEQLRDVGSCMIAIDLANRIGAAPLAVMQNMYVVHGRPAFEAKFVISCVNTCGKFSRLKRLLCLLCTRLVEGDDPERRKKREHDSHDTGADQATDHLPAAALFTFRFSGHSHHHAVEG